MHPRNKCTKFQPNATIFGLSRLPQSFSLVLRQKVVPRAQKWKLADKKDGPQGPKIKNFQKMKKTPRYSPKEQVYQISAKSNHFWAL